MTQPVSSGARWPHADESCSAPCRADSETFTCDETHEVRCGVQRAHRISPSEPHHAPALSDVPTALAFCRSADTVVEGFLCSESVVVSDACRKPRNAFDEFVCDEPRMRRLQWAILRETWAIVKALALTIVRGRL
jgi:hypothetical protein